MSHVSIPATGTTALEWALDAVALPASACWACQRAPHSSHEQARFHSEAGASPYLAATGTPEHLVNRQIKAVVK